MLQPDSRNPCGEVLLDDLPVSAHSRIEEHSRQDIARLGIRSDDGAGLFPGSMLVQRVSDLTSARARVGTVISAVDAQVSVLWGPWVPDLALHSDVVESFAQASQAIRALGRQCESAGKAMSFFVKAHAARVRR